ncbi:ras-related protein Rab-37-like isoform X2 [Hylaeus anthracinus]|uniref:ras-related protein Rab-37-like isoform X2 n=1 Tax=Hylaeus volcanicus TaxID=313075 RepID=UPI0023B84E28|nr:ras-related protein Rab-37-like isoform X2 [Hylaeus volcanicus]XP_053987523.1 ras-related protein Rab-37-like isoform X2 [Hylaeus volcanicus]XP_053987524.1 ras-related protein Rab-37-like isoform X2 [Hylaeus volcanicus]XP_053987526.1 ras-related protein Rab-37-like isoform X2 [Hylaeus volcanicus]XP_053987527.1 ras-related protein Rab-37-like isoform X2 [Hylaeus volcanicus]XP_053987528.1 ras-related protein Rab-37-like isoform X2 [Hylaeus volcanicus]XP_053987529.1 ras-related protein Rab-37
MSTVEAKLRSVTKRSRHGSRKSGSPGGDWSSGPGSSGGARGPTQPASSSPQASTSAFNRSQESMGPTRRQSSRDSVDSTGQQAPPDHGELLFKVMLLGDSGVGKTCLLTRFRDGRFLSGNYITTVGIDFRNKVVVVDDTSVKLQIWDTAGQERFRSVTHAYYRDAHALLLLYDVTNKTSYDNIRAWLSEIREHANEDVVIMLLGNKSDCGQERIVKKEDGERLAQEYKVPFMETSAKTGLNVELAFLAVARELMARKSNDPDDTKFNVQDYVRQQSQRSSCFSSNCLTT